LAGYSTHEIALTDGPMKWIDLHGRPHGQYWLFKAAEFHLALETIASTFTGAVAAARTARRASAATFAGRIGEPQQTGGGVLARIRRLGLGISL
jgi:hypothetical protein